jgi:serine/threonine protein kinase/Tol biopolymer transport system component
VSLTPGVRVGPYEVTALIGEGGMGKVWRAHHIALKRDDALKVLPDAFASDPDRLVRFQREAQVLASLNHPNIAHVYGLEQADGVQALVMELVEGPTLADRIAQGPIPLDEALPIARQIAEALEAAHEQGIIHRDLKPANIKVRPDGTVKVLDFGLAKAMEPAAGSLPSMSMSPTITTPAMTHAPMILGTAAYMSPEHARGKTVDKRTDIWAFGAVLFEMLTGARAFSGEDVAETIASVIRGEPDWTLLPPAVPAAVRATLRQCLQRDPRMRLRDIGDAQLALGGVFDSRDTGVPPVSLWRGRRAAVALVGAIVAAVAVTFTAVKFAPKPVPDVHRIRFQVGPPINTTLNDSGFALSPDSRYLAFSALDASGRPGLWLYSFETGGSRPVARNLSSANVAIWSPDNRHLAFFADGKLRKLDLADGVIQTICDTPGTSQGSWNQDDVILFGRSDSTVMRVQASGGTPTPVTALDSSRQERGHTGPRFLPDGKHFLYARVSTVPDKSGVFVGSIDIQPKDQDLRMLVSTPWSPAYAPTSAPRVGYLLYVREGVLIAQAFDNVALTLKGDSIPIAEQVGDNANATAFFAVSATGTLVYRRGLGTDGTLVWVDHNGREIGSAAPGTLTQPRFPRVSPDGRRIALTIGGDVWVYEVDGHPPIKLTFDGNHFAPLWTPDGRRIVYEASPPPTPLLSIASDGSGGMPTAVSPPGHYHPHGWSADVRWLVAVRLQSPDTYRTAPSSSPRNRSDIVKIPFGENGELQPVVQTQATEGAFGTAVSPDGRWLAYVSDITGQSEVWVQPLPGPGPPVRVSANGGVEPVWSKSARELYYLEGDAIMSVAVEGGATFNFKPPAPLFKTNGYLQTRQPPSYDVAPDGRFLMIKLNASTATTAPLEVIVNWPQALASLVPVH